MTSRRTLSDVGTSALVGREKRLRAIAQAQSTDPPADRLNSEGVSANKTRVYSDTVGSQNVMVGLYMLLPIWMALLVPMVSSDVGFASDVELSRSGNENEMLFGVRT